MSRLVVVDPLPWKSWFSCFFFCFAFVFWSCRVGEYRTSLPSCAISLFRGFLELALESLGIAENLNLDARSQEEILKYFYLHAGGSFRELQRLLEDAAEANVSDAQGIARRIRDVRASRPGSMSCTRRTSSPSRTFSLKRTRTSFSNSSGVSWDGSPSPSTWTS